MRHHSFMRWASATMAALMFFQCTAPVAFATDDTVLAGSSVTVSSNNDESVPADSDAGYIPEQKPDDMVVSDSDSVDSSTNASDTENPSVSSETKDSSSVESDSADSTDEINSAESNSEEELPSDDETVESPSQGNEETNEPLYQDGKILIHTYDQLKEIGSGDTLTDSTGTAVTDENGSEVTYAQDGQYDADKKLSSKRTHLYTWGRCGVNQETGEIDPNLDIDKATGQTYATNANYIIFRDIDLSSKNWLPLMFQGTMIGAKANDGEKIWNDDSSEIIATEKPILSNVNVVQTGELDVGNQMGVGFFATLSDEASANDIGISKTLVQVSNLRFNNISVDNKFV